MVNDPVLPIFVTDTLRCARNVVLRFIHVMSAMRIFDGGEIIHSYPICFLLNGEEGYTCTRTPANLGLRQDHDISRYRLSLRLLLWCSRYAFDSSNTVDRFYFFAG